MADLPSKIEAEFRTNEGWRLAKREATLIDELIENYNQLIDYLADAERNHNAMSKELTTEQATEKIARRMAKEKTGSEGLWEMFLTDAYQEYFKLPKASEL